VTDPPYNVDYVGKTADALKIENDKMSPARFLEFLTNTHRIAAGHTKPGGAWYVWHADSEGLNFRTAFQAAGLDLKQTLIWVKNTIMIGRQDYQWKHEPCLYGWKPGAAHYFTPDRTLATVIDDKLNINKLSKDEMKALLKEIYSEKTHTSIIYHDKPSRSAEHPTMKPVPLIGYQIKNSSKPMQIVLDNFAGSGTALVASEQLGRRCFAMELDPKYCQVIIDRMRKLKPDIKIEKIN
jgi:DNA modification methylase